MTAGPSVEGPGRTILVTGAGGFVGRSVTARLLQAGHRVRAVVRDVASAPPGVDVRVVGEIGEAVEWGRHLEDVSGVIHLAARVHVLHDTSSDPAALYRRVNVEGTRRLAEACRAAGVRRLVFVSTIKVNGEGRDQAYSETDAPAPTDPYGVSKLEAEETIRGIGRESALEWTILRPPLVYGPGVRGNFRRLLGLAALSRRAPLPLGGVTGRRSLLYLENLADILVRSLESPAAASQLFLLSDGEDLTSGELVRRLATTMGFKARLFSLPEGLIRSAAGLVGKSGEAARLLDSLRVDSSQVRRTLNWVAPFSVDQGLSRTVEWWRSVR